MAIKDERKLKAEKLFAKRKGNGKRKRGNFVPTPKAERTEIREIKKHTNQGG